MAKKDEEKKEPDLEVHEDDAVEVVDDDGHTLEDITPWDIDEDDDDETAQNNEDDPEEYLTWDRDEHGSMADYATESEEDEPECCGPNDDDVEVGE